MQKGLFFWVLMIVWALFGLWVNWPTGSGGPSAYGPVGGSALLFLLIGVLGWKVFGPPLQG